MRAIGWIIRVPLYVFCAWLSLAVIAPALPGSSGLLLTAPLAAGAICLDLWITSVLKGRTVSAEVSDRVLVADHLFSPPGRSLADSISQRPELEVEELDVLESGARDERGGPDQR